MNSIFEALTEHDKKLIDFYRAEYGETGACIAPISDYLSEWAKNKSKLFKLLDNQLIVKIPYTYQIDENKKTQIVKKYFSSNEKQINSILDIVATFLYNHLDNDMPRYKDDTLSYPNVYATNRIGTELKFHVLDSKGKQRNLRFDKETKPFRVLQKICEYITEEEVLKYCQQTYTDIITKEEFIKNIDDFRIKISMINNQKVDKASLCFSIHPLDFMTVSDNANDWSSCMSWTDDGCYHAGTVEMMNSNNVICCYLEKEDGKKYDLATMNSEASDDCEHAWNSKIWRSYCYVEKDIICAGKSYPYKSEDLSKKIILEVKERAEKAFNWTYQFGPQEYKDMERITPYRLENLHMQIRRGKAKKHNILFDMDRMYNDMFNDNRYTYWCYRNKVKHSKIIHLSGNMVCNCCGEVMKVDKGDRFYSGNDDDSDYYMSTYNDRNGMTDKITCVPCLEIRCYSCGKGLGSYDKEDYVHIKTRWSEDKLMCRNCICNVAFCTECGNVLDDGTYSFLYGKYVGFFVNDKNIHGLTEFKEFIDKNPKMLEVLSHIRESSNLFTIENNIAWLTKHYPIVPILMKDSLDSCGREFYIKYKEKYGEASLDFYYNNKERVYDPDTNQFIATFFYDKDVLSKEQAAELDYHKHMFFLSDRPIAREEVPEATERLKKIREAHMLKVFDK